MKSDLVDLDVLLVHETRLAVLVRLDEDAEKVWLPLSAVEIERQPRGRARLTLRAALAQEKGLL